jgi:hypothetical protein
MSRPQPHIICSHSDNNLIVEVCEADAVYAVLYQGRPIKLRKHNPENRYLGMKYSKTSFPEPGHAVALARRLNAAYNTTDFSVVVMAPGKTIY